MAKTIKLKPVKTVDIYYLSFVGDEGFRGVCLVEATDPVNAVQVAHRRGINPGGEVMITLVPRDVYVNAPKVLPLNLLMSKEELIRLGGPVKSLGEMKKEGIEWERADGTPMVCSHCNRTDPHKHKAN